MKNQLFEHVRNSIVFSEIPTVYWYTKKLYLKVPTSEDGTLERDFFGGRDKKDLALGKEGKQDLLMSNLPKTLVQINEESHW